MAKALAGIVGVVILLHWAGLQDLASAQTTQPRAFVPRVLTTAPAARSAFQNEDLWPDTQGVHINAHAGGVLWHEGVYYWYGEHRAPRTPETRWPPSPGVSCYSSTDLYNWAPLGVVMHTVDDPDSPITRGCALERPKVIYNAKTKQFVMWFHLELRGRGYGAALTGLATANGPTGPFTFVRAVRPNAGKWPIDFPNDLRSPLDREQVRAMTQDRSQFRKALVDGVYTRRDFAGGQMARDMTLYVDPDDGKAYHIASAEENYTLNIHELNDDYTDFTGKWMRVTPAGHNEAPAVLKRNGRYYILASGCTGWDPNPARVLVADSMWGPWTNAGNPCVGVNPSNGMGPEKTFGGQSTFILPVQGRPDAYIAMFDVWRPQNIIESGYVWLPIRFDGDRMVIEWRQTWKLATPAEQAPPNLSARAPSPTAR